MNRDDLARFLASQRKKRFIDYLDPIGETAPKAFERRLRWAERSQDDPAKAEEARFLLDNIMPLREVIRDEMEAESGDWVTGVEAGAGTGGWRGSTKSATDASMIGTPPPAVRVGDIEEVDHTGIMRLEDVTPPGPVARSAAPPPRPPKPKAPTPAPVSRGARSSVDLDAATPVPADRAGSAATSDTPPTVMRSETPQPVLNVVPRIGTPSPQPSRGKAAAPPIMATPAPAPMPPPPPSGMILPRRQVTEDRPAPPPPPPARSPLPMYAAIGGVLGLVILVGGVFGWKALHPPEPEAPVAPAEVPPEVPEAPPAEVVPPEAPPTEPAAPEVPPVEPAAPPVEAAKAEPPKPEPPKPEPPKPAPVKAEPAKQPPKPREPARPPTVTKPGTIVLSPTAEPEKPAEKPPEAPPAPVAAGRYAGKAGGQFLALTIRGSGGAITAAAQVQTDDGPVDYAFQGSFDPASGAITLTDAANGAKLVGTLTGNKITGTGSLGAGMPDISWSASR